MVKFSLDTATLAIFLSFGFASQAMSQDQCGCSAALDANLLDVFEVRLGSQGRFTSQSAMCDEANRTTSTTRSVSGGGSYAGIGANVDIGKTSASSDFKKVCSEEFQDADNKAKTEIIKRSINPVLAASFQQCILACNNTEFGFKVERRNQLTTINIFNKRGENHIRNILLNVEDNDTTTNEDDLVECRLKIGSNNITVPKSVTDDLPSEIQTGLAITEGSAIISCEREIASAASTDGSKTLNYYPAYAIQVAVGEDIIIQDVPMKPVGSLTSPEFDLIQETLLKMDSELIETFANAQAERSADLLPLESAFIG